MKPVRSRSTGRRVVVSVGRVVIVAAAASLVGTGVAVGAAAWSATPGVFIGVGLAVAAAVAAGACALLLRRQPARPRRVAAVVAVVVTVALTVGWLVPLGSPPPDLPASASPRWLLATGSHLEFRHVPAVSAPDRPRRPWPVVVLHGGPGIPDLIGDQAVWGQLARDGFDVYVYAQLGAGGSTRLVDPAGYGLDRDVADLEQVRRLLGVDKMVLVGHSYGALLAAGYLAAHPSRVDRLVLTSPAPLDPADHSTAQATSRLSLAQRLHLAPLVLQPRALLGYLLLQVNPIAAHAYLGDVEADRRNDAVLDWAQSGLHCPGHQPPPPVTGSGFYRLQYPQSATAPPPPDLRPHIQGRPIPVLVLKGGCDYLSWTSVQDYRRVLPDTTLVYLPDAGHDIYQDKPDQLLTAARAFLADQPPPIRPYTATSPPPDYQHD